MIEDLSLARQMIDGGWLAPDEGRLRLLGRLVEIADRPETPPSFRLGAINSLTRIDEHLRKLRADQLKADQLRRETNSQNAVHAAIRILSAEADAPGDDTPED